MKRFHTRLGIIAAILLLTACATSPTGRNQLMLISPEQAVASSRMAYLETIKELDSEGKIDTDPELAARVRKITGRIVAQAIELYPETSKWQWSIKVIDDPEMVNAWCMAGGRMAVYTGLIEKVEPTDDELAQVLGHEISHALANHTAEKMSVALATQVALIGTAIAVSDKEYAGAALTGAALAATAAIKLPNSRSAEREADEIGIELAARAGYDPDAAVSLWRKMGEVGGEAPIEFLSTHPSPVNREQRLKELAPQMQKYYESNEARPVYKLN